MTRVRRVPKIRRLVDLPEPLVRYLTTGEYGSDYDSFTLAGQVLHRDYAQLRTLWAEHGKAILADWDDDAEPLFAARVLEVVDHDPDDWRGVLDVVSEYHTTERS